MATITIMDPVTRIEGHLKVEVTIDKVGGVSQVTDARCTGTQFRGFEVILKGRDPLDAPLITERICGVCPVSHGYASTLALEKAANRSRPANARIMRNLVLGANFLQSHILHFYLLAALDYVKGPAGSDGKVSNPWAPAWDVDLRAGVAEIGGHIPAAIEARRRAHEMGAVFGGKLPNPATYLAGGFTATPSASRIGTFRSHLSWLTGFIRSTYIPDVELLSSVYSDYLSLGKGHGNLMAFGAFDLNDAATSKLFRGGTIQASAPTVVNGLDINNITESVTYSWYDNTTNNLKPASGNTRTVDPGLKPAAYSWLKAPRYGGKPFEAGPLARMWVNGEYRRGISIMDRHLARASEALKVALAMDGWLNQLVTGGSVYASYTTPSTGAGVGLTEAPRGALGHWVSISSQKIANYQVITPTCWNASPKDGGGVRGPMEQALIGLPVAQADKPIEVLRLIHSYDPCLSCAVHVMRPEGKPVVLHAGARSTL
ncbi:MAG: nickel-dependent hydrogenase large subunit [Syntrophobacteraceae bacterium]|jgi:hydrogenase large subunit|nr:nickel-dependent hydrogenase large subunit [Syntrophobacteraceae bacterium]